MPQNANVRQKQTSQQSKNIELPSISKQTAGAVAGAAVGSIAGPIGAVVGGVAGALAGKAIEKRRARSPKHIHKRRPSMVHVLKVKPKGPYRVG